MSLPHHFLIQILKILLAQVKFPWLAGKSQANSCLSHRMFSFQLKISNLSVAEQFQTCYIGTKFQEISEKESVQFQRG